MEATSKVNKQNARKYSCTEWWGLTSAPLTPTPAQLLSCSISMETVCPAQTQNRCTFYLARYQQNKPHGHPMSTTFMYHTFCYRTFWTAPCLFLHYQVHFDIKCYYNCLLKIYNLTCTLAHLLYKWSKCADEFLLGFWSSEGMALMWITSMLFSSEGLKILNKRAQTWQYDAPWALMSP